MSTTAGDWTVGGALVVTGTSTLTGATTVTGALTASSTAAVTGLITGAAGATITGDLRGSRIYGPSVDDPKLYPGFMVDGVLPPALSYIRMYDWTTNAWRNCRLVNGTFTAA